MSVQEIQRLSEDLKTSSALQDAFRQAGTDPAAIARLAKERGYDITEADLKTAAKQAKAEMSDEQLDDVAGGTAVVVLTGGAAVVVVVAS